ncbi:MAG: HPr family phosphocarrier protein [Sphingomonas fennica]
MSGAAATAGDALRQTVLIANKRGLHARASAKFVTLASAQDAEIEVEKDGSRVAGTSIMGLMMLGAAMGDHVVISASGPKADAALAALVELVEAKFGEE